MYYFLILLSVAMFGGCFALRDVYRRMRGDTLKISIQFTMISSAAGFLILLIANGFRIEYTPFTLIMATLSALNGLAFSFCSFKALGSINLSVYSLFSMLGGMMLPFLQGILFYQENLSLAKILCVVFLTAALLLPIQWGNGGKGAIYYIGVFILNGMSGVMAKFFSSAPFAKTDAAGYSLLSALCSALMAAILLLLFFRKTKAPKLSLRSEGICSLSGIINTIANFILVAALARVDASVQYPMVTGGVIIVSTIICFWGKNKPAKRDLISVCIAFIGLMLLFALPI